LKPIRLVQKPLSELIKVVFVQHPVDLGRFTVRLLGDIIPEIKDELGWEFDEIRIYPGPQPRGTGDIELFKGGELVGRISVKTAVSGDLKTALRRIWRDLERGRDGMVLYFATGKKKGSEEEELKLIIIYLPSGVASYTRSQVYYEIQDKIDEKTSKENYEKLVPLAVNEAIMFETLKRTLMMEMEAKKAYEEAKKAYEEAKKAGEKAEKAYEEAKKASETAEKAYEEAKIIRELLEKLKSLLSRTK